MNESILAIDNAPLGLLALLYIDVEILDPLAQTQAKCF